MHLESLAKKDGGMMRDEIKVLGALITKDLGLKDDYDILNKWMITYIAEQMTKYESAETEEERQVAGEHSIDTILKFWRHRAYNVSQNPFAEYKELFVGLKRLLADESEMGLEDFLGHRDIDRDDLAEQVRKIKKVALWLIEDRLEAKVDELSIDDSEEWLQIAKELDDGDDARIIELISDASVDHKRMVAEIVQERIAAIEEVILLYGNLLNMYQSQLDQL